MAFSNASRVLGRGFSLEGFRPVVADKISDAEDLLAQQFNANYRLLNKP